MAARAPGLLVGRRRWPNCLAGRLEARSRFVLTRMEGGGARLPINIDRDGDNDATEQDGVILTVALACGVGGLALFWVAAVVVCQTVADALRDAGQSGVGGGGDETMTDVNGGQIFAVAAV